MYKLNYNRKGSNRVIDGRPRPIGYWDFLQRSTRRSHYSLRVGREVGCFYNTVKCSSSSGSSGVSRHRTIYVFLLFFKIPRPLWLVRVLTGFRPFRPHRSESEDGTVEMDSCESERHVPDICIFVRT